MIIWIRHCATTGQEPGAPLSSEGYAQARALAQLLGPLSISRVVSSPYVRAVQSIEPFATKYTIQVETDPRLRERVLTSESLDDWKATLRRTFEDADYAAPGGETSREAEARAFAVLQDSVANIRTTAIVSHGNLTSRLLRRLGWPMDFDTSLRLSNPDVFRIRAHGGTFDITRLWN